MVPKSAEQAEQKTRRRPGRVPTSCAECRRLKLRCDRKVPCETCVKRGCSAICPDGSLTAGKGNRLVLANTEELHDKIERLCSRIRELEDALRILHGNVSDEPHPLLHPDLLQMKTPVSAGQAEGPAPKPTSPPAAITKSEEDTFLDAFGTLTINSHGQTLFLGKTARTEYLIHANNLVTPPPTLSFSRFSQRLADASLFASNDIHHIDAELARQIFAMLPPLSEAIKLCETYLVHGQYLWYPVERSELFDEILTIIYRTDSPENFKCYHALSLLFTVFSLAALFDPARPQFNIEAQEYYLLGWITLHTVPPYRETTLSGVQTMINLAQYLELSDWQALGISKGWVYAGIAAKFAHILGLHLNSSRWKLDHLTTQRRSRVFWQIFLLDTWLSFGFGRPPNLSNAFIDCSLPEDIYEFVGPDGKKEMGYHLWTWQYTRLMHNVVTNAFGVKIPPYHAILEMDRKVRDFPVPSYLRPLCDLAHMARPELTMQRWFVLSCKEATLLNLHRCYFAQALHDQPNDLLKHKYAPSVMAAYRSAWRLIEGIRTPWENTPTYIARINLSWSQALSAAIVMCMLVTKAPNSSLTSSSLTELDRITDIFENAAPTCRAASNNLESVRKLRRKAHEVVDQSHSHETENLTPTELDRLGGKTHLIAEVSESTSTSSSPTTSTSGSGSGSGGETQYASTPDSLMTGYESMDNLHPTILQDMKIFDGIDLSHINEIFDFPPETFPQAMNDVQFPDQTIFGVETLSLPPPHQAPNNNNVQMGQQQPQQQVQGGNQSLALDATWQNFVEQLGF